MEMNIDLTGTISTILPRERDINGDYIQRIMLTNVSTVNANIQVNPTVILHVKTDARVTIPFKIGDPISLRGRYNSSTGVASLPIVTYAHAPHGFIRYTGIVYQ